MKSKKSDKEKEKKDTKQRFLSPSFKKGGIKETKPQQEGGDLFKLDVMSAEEEEEASPPPKKSSKTSQYSRRLKKF